jgi:hypothetical protein
MDADSTKYEPAWLRFYRRAQSFGVFKSELLALIPLKVVN